MPLFRKKAVPAFRYDPETQEPAVRKSICTGEMTLGYIDKATGQFHDVILVDQDTLDEIIHNLKLTNVKTIY